MSSGKAALATEKRVVERIRRRRSPVVNESGATYGQSWHGQLRTGVDVRAWREAQGLYVKELAELLGVTPESLIKALAQ